MSKNFKILVQSENGEDVKIEIEGSRVNIMIALGHLSRTLLQESNLTKKDIKEAIETGLMSDEEIEEERKRIKADLQKKIEKLFNEMF